MNNIIAIFTIFLVGSLFYFMFRSLFSELIKTATLSKKDGFLITKIILIYRYQWESVPRLSFVQEKLDGLPVGSVITDLNGCGG